MKIKYLLLVLIFIYSVTFAQSFQIVKLIDNNLFELETGKQAKFYGLYIPSLKDTASNNYEIAKEINKWENDFLLESDFTFKFMGKDTNGVLEAKIIKERSFYDENMAEKLLTNGYATLLAGNDKLFNSSLIEFQERAQENNYGLWKNKIIHKEDLAKTSYSNKQNIPFYGKTYERPYLPLLGIGIASFALAWDEFADASDIQSSIDNFNNDIYLIPQIYSSIGIELRQQIENGYKDEIENLKNDKSRKIIVGVTCLVAGIITTLYSFKTVEVRTDFQSLSLSYRF